MKNLLGVLALSATLAACQSKNETQHHEQAHSHVDSVTMNQAMQKSMSWKHALEELKKGNARFQSGRMAKRNHIDDMKVTSKGQYPHTFILSCMDSRKSCEIIFDQGLGDMFNVRIAGSFVNKEVLGCMEYACKLAGAKLIVGHSHCGAIKGACDKLKLGNLTAVINEIKPALNLPQKIVGELNSHNHEYVEAVAHNNVHLSLQEIKANSPILKELLDKGDIGLIGGMYDVNTGKVSFFE